MSSDKTTTEAEAADNCCASCSCGIAEVDDIKLKPCDDCDLVRYCSDECREIHKSEHEEDCKKRAAELRDELLFKQPESSHLGDCPSCSLPLPFDIHESIKAACCSKYICKGCDMAHQREDQDARREKKCPFCRESLPATYEKSDEQAMKRIEANDPVAIFHQGSGEYKKGNYRSAFEYWTKAADLGNAWAHWQLSCFYHHGLGVEKDEGKSTQHLEEAAIGGHPNARYHLGCKEWNSDNDERAVKHWVIAATQGEGQSITDLIDAFKHGLISKEDLTETLRAHQATVDATKSTLREEAEVCFKSKGIF